jgi:aryl-alcohol dehydrogenase-like predicted oxidoreductase
MERVKTRTLGTSGFAVSDQGLGCMGMSPVYGIPDEPMSLATVDRALELGINFFDTANVYGGGHNEKLIGRALGARRENVVLATKFSLGAGPDGKMAINGRPEYVRQCVEESLSRLGTDYIDLYYQHRVDRTVPIEETVGAMAELVQAGKVRALGLSEASARTIERAAAVHPIAALQSEWSLWSRDLEAEVLPMARRHGVAIVPYSPLGRGFLTGAITSPDQLAEGDFRRTQPRFAGENFDQNMLVVEGVRKLAEEKGCTPGQLALAWVLAQGDDVIPIPGTKRVTYLEENVAASDVEVTAADLARLDEIAPVGVAAGSRYAPGMTSSFGDSPEPTA